MKSKHCQIYGNALLLLYLFDFFRLDTAKKLNLDNNRKFLYNKIRSGIRKIRL